MAVEKIEVVIEAKNNVKTWLSQAKDDIDWFQKRIKSETAIEMSVKLAELRSQLQKARSDLKEAIKQWNKEAEIQIRVDVETLSKEITQANRELNNFLRTGQKDISVLGKLFDSVNQNISKTRDLLSSMWNKSALNKFNTEVNNLDIQLKKWNITNEQYNQSITSISENAIKSSSWLIGFWKAVASLFAFWVVTDFFKRSADNFIKFEAGLARINTVARLSKTDLEWLGQWIQGISERLPVTNQELLDTAFNIASAWVEAKNILPILELSSQVAIWAVTDTTTAFNGIIGVVKSYWLNLSEATNIANLFFKANELWQTTVWEIATNIGDRKSVV